MQRPGAQANPGTGGGGSQTRRPPAIDPMYQGWMDSKMQQPFQQMSREDWNRIQAMNKRLRMRGIGGVGSSNSRGTNLWGSPQQPRMGGQMSPALMQMFGGGGSEEELMALLQQLGLGG